jgi:hypothetical protein
MSRLNIGDQVTAADAEGDGEPPLGNRRFPPATPHGTVRFVRDGDVVVVPSHPGEGFPAHVRRVNGSAEGEPPTVIPPSGRQGAESLYDDRLAAPEFVAGLRTPTAHREGDLLPFPLDAAVSRRAHGVGPDGSCSGVAFPAGRGGELVTNQVSPVSIVWMAEEILRSLLSARQPVIAQDSGLFLASLESEV